MVFGCVLCAVLCSDGVPPQLLAAMSLFWWSKPAIRTPQNTNIVFPSGFYLISTAYEVHLMFASLFGRICLKAQCTLGGVCKVCRSLFPSFTSTRYSLLAAVSAAFFSCCSCISFLAASLSSSSVFPFSRGNANTFVSSISSPFPLPSFGVRCWFLSAVGQFAELRACAFAFGGACVWKQHEDEVRSNTQ